MSNKESKRGKKWVLFLIGGIALCLIVSGILIYAKIASNEYRVDITLNGQAEITLEYGESFSDPGAEAIGYGTVLHKDSTELEITTKGKVDTQKIGTYTITYRASFEGVEEKVTRTVHIVDTVPPEISLVTDPEHFTIPGQEYQEEGYTATDNYDGDITDRVTSRVENGMVIYTVEDSSGNRTEVQRTIIYRDPEAPELILQGEAKIFINAGDSWVEPGYSAMDNVDGDMTSKVTVSGKVENYQPGTYVLTYTVTDSYGNKTTANRTVVVKGLSQPDVVAPNGKVIYLTFDDGPSAHTPRLLEVLKKYNVKATFFVCNTGRLDLLDDIVNGGHSIGMHSMTHEYKNIYASEEAYFNDLRGMQDLIYKYTGVMSTLMRFPGGSSNSVSKFNPGIMTRLTAAVEAQGFQYFDWHITSGDAGETKNTNTIISNVINGIKRSKRDHIIVLQHDIYNYSVSAVEEIIIWGLNNGYTFLPLEPNSPVCHHGVKN